MPYKTLHACYPIPARPDVLIMHVAMYMGDDLEPFAFLDVEPPAPVAQVAQDFDAVGIEACETFVQRERVGLDVETTMVAILDFPHSGCNTLQITIKPHKSGSAYYGK